MLSGKVDNGGLLLMLMRGGESQGDEGESERGTEEHGKVFELGVVWKLGEDVGECQAVYKRNLYAAVSRRLFGRDVPHRRPIHLDSLIAPWRPP